MLAKIVLNKAKVTQTSGIDFVEVSLGVSSHTCGQFEVANLKELKEVVLKALKENPKEHGVNVSVITRGRAVRGFNAWYDSMPKFIAPGSIDQIDALK